MKFRSWLCHQQLQDQRIPLASKPRTHLHKTRNNTPGAVPAIINEHHVIEPHGVPKRRSPLLHNAYEAPIITIANLFVLELYIQRQEKQSPHTKNSSLTLFITYEVWSTAFGKEFGSLAQGDNKNGEKGTNFLYVMSPEDIRKIPKDRVITYGRIAVNYSP